MKTILHLAPHSVVPGATIVELWHDGRLIGTVAGADGPGVRIVSKHPVHVLFASGEFAEAFTPAKFKSVREEMVIEVRITTTDDEQHLVAVMIVTQAILKTKG